MRTSEPGPVAPCRITVLGATGSVGSSTLDLVARNAQRFPVVALTAQSNVDGLAAVAIAHRAQLAVIGDEARYHDLKLRLAGTGIRAAAGTTAIEEAAAEPADCVVAAIVGAAGLMPALAAVRQGRRVALANKECLVSAGDHFMAEVARHGCDLIPVDSEHSGVLQALAGTHRSDIARITLTASGGPFRSWTVEQIAGVTVEQALKHPNWSMGRKITIDSATMMNKGLELIEAYHLFAVGPERLAVVVHPQSIVHALVETVDGSVMAQLASHDMRVPIAVALAWPGRMQTPVARLDLVALQALTFEAPDEARFPALALARTALERGGAAATVLNAANEIAVEAFLAGALRFPEIAEVVAHTLELADKRGHRGRIADAVQALHIDTAARLLARESIARHGRR